MVDTDDFGRETGKLYFRVAGMSEAMRVQFSKRRAAILGYMDKHPATNAQAATLATRRSKDESTCVELTDLWARAVDRMRQSDPDLPTSAQMLKERPNTIGGIDDEVEEAAWSLGRVHAQGSDVSLGARRSQLDRHCGHWEASRMRFSHDAQAARLGGYCSCTPSIGRANGCTRAQAH